MPKRSTPFQAIVRLVRQHFAGPDVTVTESKLLSDVVLGIDREVDIVVEGQFDGEPVVVSIEVIERSRPAAVNWVQEMVRKHRDLPTNRLLLVSQSGFTSSALAAVDLEAGRVQALTPEIIEVDGCVIVERFYLDTIIYKPMGCRVHFTVDNEGLFIVGEVGTDIYTSDGTLLGSLSQLVADVLQLPLVGERLSVEAHNHPEREHVKAFTFDLTIPQLGTKPKCC